MVRIQMGEVRLWSAAALLAMLQPLASAKADQLGSCSVLQLSRFAGAYKACVAPVTTEQCEALGQNGQFRDPVFSVEGCDQFVEVGSCDQGYRSIYYYEGDPAELAVGCGHQGGDWK